ncbi:MAG: D-alanyl-D-alanine carboxypeptidase/D-alanyl-D-alanine-endopeptidase, partial [Pedobacter sp.]
MRLKIPLLFISILAGNIVGAQNRIQNLEKAFNNLLADEQAKHAITSLCVLDANTGKVLFAKNEQIGLA